MANITYQSKVLTVNGMRLSTKVNTPTQINGFGYLYNYYAITGETGTDEHISSDDNWVIPIRDNFENLIRFIDGETGGDSAYHLRTTGTEYWNNSNGLNTYGFTAKGAGLRGNYEFIDLLIYTRFRTLSSGFFGHTSYFIDFDQSIMYDNFRSENDEGGESVRLVNTNTLLSHGQTGTYTGNDGKEYLTICINGKDTEDNIFPVEWLASNLAETLYRGFSEIPTVTNQSEWAALTTGAKCAYNNDENYV
jgi:uncharacterized protein (TIGR02145 family)